MTAAQTLLKRAHYIPIAVIGIYGLIIGLLTIPIVQREFIFMHRVKFPLFADFNNPVKYGFSPFKVRNFKVDTPDGETIGAWHILAKSFYRQLQPFPPSAPLPEIIFDQSLTIRPTILYFHGNAMHRAAPYRLRSYTAFSNQLDCNVIAIDYRGFGDSTGLPSEEGLLIDAHAIWDKTVGKMVGMGMSEEEAAENIIVLGHSLGTGVAAGLAGQLANEGVNPRAIVLIAPFTSVADLLSTYKLFFVLPLLGPFRAFPVVSDYLKSFLVSRFNSTEALANTTSPTLVIHSTSDNVIPNSHSSTLFSSALDLASTLIEDSDAKIDPKEIVDGQGERTRTKTPTKSSLEVSETVYEGWGTVRSFERGEGKGEVVWWEGAYGGHNHIGSVEGTMDLIARVARL